MELTRQQATVLARYTGDLTFIAYEKGNFTWNVIMPVVDKILADKDHMNDYYYFTTFGMRSYDGELMVRIHGNPLFTAPTLLEATLLSVVNFIQRHHTQE